MQPLTFACSACGKRVGVPAEFAGRKVRCPHCKGIVVAPTAADPPVPVAPIPLPPPPVAAPTVATPAPPITFSAPTEGAESIFGEAEEDDDSLFAAPKPKLRPLPSPQPDPPPTPIADDNPFAVMDTAPATETHAAESAAPRVAKKPATPARPIPWKLVLIVLLAGYSFVMTIVAAIGWLR